MTPDYVLTGARYHPKPTPKRQLRQLQFAVDRIVVQAETDLEKGTRFIVELKGDVTEIGSDVTVRVVSNAFMAFVPEWVDKPSDLPDTGGWRIVNRLVA
jgi:hypothetical protein